MSPSVPRTHALMPGQPFETLQKMPTTIEKDKVLVVDDVKVNRILARAYLELLGWKVDECASGQAVLDYARDNTPECILLDIQMPDIDGLEVAKILRQTWPVGMVKIVAYTAHAITEEVAHIRASGFDDLLIKPIILHDVSAIFGARQSGKDKLN